MSVEGFEIDLILAQDETWYDPEGNISFEICFETGDIQVNSLKFSKDTKSIFWTYNCVGKLEYWTFQKLFMRECLRNLIYYYV